MNLQAWRQDVRRWGVARVLAARSMAGLERALGLHVFVVHARPLDAAAPHAQLPEGCSVGVLPEAALLAFAGDPALDLPVAFVRQARARGDLCFGYVERGVLVSYVWIAAGSTPAEAGLWVEFAAGDSYAYKAFTRASHRGRRLQQCLSDCSDRHMTALGYRNNIDYVRVHNLASIAADRSHGNRVVGHVGYLRGFGRVLPFHSRGAARRGFRFVRIARAALSGGPSR